MGWMAPLRHRRALNIENKTALVAARAESSYSLPVRPCQGSGPGSRPAATSASRPR